MVLYTRGATRRRTGQWPWRRSDWRVRKRECHPRLSGKSPCWENWHILILCGGWSVLQCEQPIYNHGW